MLSFAYLDVKFCECESHTWNIVSLFVEQFEKGLDPYVTIMLHQCVIYMVYMFKDGLSASIVVVGLVSKI